MSDSKYVISRQDGKVQVYVKILTPSGKYIHSYVAERDNDEEAQELIRRIEARNR